MWLVKWVFLAFWKYLMCGSILNLNIKLLFCMSQISCNNCGLTFCSKCTGQKIAVPKKNNEVKPVCTRCYNILTGWVISTLVWVIFLFYVEVSVKLAYAFTDDMFSTLLPPLWRWTGDCARTWLVWGTVRPVIFCSCLNMSAGAYVMIF